MEMIFLFLTMHALCDFPLQGEAMSRGKSRRRDLRAEFGPDFPPWYAWLSAHTLIHGGGVYLVCGVWWIGAIEVLLHAAIDHLKCEGRISFHQDQALHLTCKAMYVGILALI